MTVDFFKHSNYLSQLIFPYLTADELARIGYVNKESQKASRVDGLWENLYNLLPYARLSLGKASWSWRTQYITQANWEKRIYRELPLRSFKRSSKLLKCSYLSPPKLLTITQTEVIIFDLESNEKMTLKAAGFDERERFLNHVYELENYICIKTDKEIQIYNNPKGDLFRTIPLSDADWKCPTLAYSKNLNVLVSIDQKGTVIRVWDMRTWELTWETKIEENPIHAEVSLFYFSSNAIYCNRSLDTWSIHIPSKSIQKAPVLKVFYPEKIPPKKGEYLDRRIEKGNEYTADQKTKRLDRHFTANLIHKLGRFPNPNSLVYREGLDQNFSSGFYPYIAFSHDFISKDFLRLPSFSYVRVGDVDKLKAFFFKRFNNYAIQKVEFSASQLLIAAKKYDSQGKTFFSDLDIFTYDFCPLAKPIKHLDHKEDSLSSDSPALSLNLWQRIRARVISIFNAIYRFFSERMVNIRLGLQRIFRVIRAR